MRASDLLPVEDENGDSYGTGDKRIERASLTIDGRHAGPDKRIVSIETRDGWTYRFQRFGRDEPLVLLDRTPETGETRTNRGGQIPRSIERYVAALDAETIKPEMGQVVSEDAQAQAEPEPIMPQPARADGGEPERVECRDCDRTLPPEWLDDGLCPRCVEIRTIEAREQDRHRSAHPTVDDPTPRHEYGDQDL